MKVLTKEYFRFLQRAAGRINWWYNQDNTIVDVNSWILADMCSMLKQMFDALPEDEKDKYKEVFGDND